MSSRYFFQFVVCLLNLFVMFTELCRHFRVLCGLIYHFKNDSQVSRHVQKCVSHSAIRKFILPSPFQSFMVLFLCDLNLIDLEFIGIWSEIEIQLYLFPDGRSWVPTLSLKVLFFFHWYETPLSLCIKFPYVWRQFLDPLFCSIDQSVFVLITTVILQ